MEVSIRTAGKISDPDFEALLHVKLYRLQARFDSSEIPRAILTSYVKAR